MAELVRVVDRDTGLFFELESDSGSKGRTSETGISDWLRDRVFGDGKKGEPAKLADISATISGVRAAVAQSFGSMAAEKRDGENLESFTVKFGIKVSAEGNTFVAKAGAEANLEVTFSWSFD